jgi:hypothetical protein
MYMNTLVSMLVMLSKKFIETFNIKKLNFVFNKLLNTLQKLLRIVPNVNWEQFFFALLLRLNNLRENVALEQKKLIFVKVIKS